MEIHFEIFFINLCVFFRVWFIFADIERQDRYAVLAAISGILVTLLWRANSTRYDEALQSIACQILNCRGTGRYPPYEMSGMILPPSIYVIYYLIKKVAKH